MSYQRPALIITLLLIVTYTIGYRSYITPQSEVAKLSPALPAPLLTVIGHSYLHQLVAEALFIKTAVYYGAIDNDPEPFQLKLLSQHFLTMQQLHPYLLDTYYRSESILAHRGSTYAITTNTILAHGRETLPKQIALPFFEGFNYFRYLNQPLKAGEILRIASQIEGSPSWIGHLASMLLAKGGNIRAGLIWLQGMYASSEDEETKARYKKDIVAFEKAMTVQLALEQFARKHGTFPEKLTLLLPEELDKLPAWEGHYQLEYKKPKLFLHSTLKDHEQKETR